MNSTVTKAELARELGISKARISQLIDRGMPVRADGRVDLDAATMWYRDNIRARRSPKLGRNRRLTADRAHPPAETATPSVSQTGASGGHDGGLHRDSTILARSAVTGLSTPVLELLAGIRTNWPGLAQRTVRLLGGSELEAARAVAMLEELIESLAIGLPPDSAGGPDLPDILPPAPVLDWSAEAAALVDGIRNGEPDWRDTPEGEALTSAMLDAGEALGGLQ